MRFEFATAEKILFGPGVLHEAGAILASWGRRVLICLGIPQERAAILLDDLSRRGLDFDVYPVFGEPTVELVSKGCLLARERGCDAVVGLGGGSAIDTAKAIAVLVTNGGEILDYLEVIGKGSPLVNPPLPWMAIPTTAGTGAEVTRNAVIGSPGHGVKVSLRSPLMLAKVALVDPELTYGLPPAITASTGLDALTQLIEPFVSVRANPMTDAFCREGLQRVARSLRRAYEQDNPQARQEMSLASLLGGLALANAGLGTVHGFAGVLGGMLHAPHGAICARLLPFVMKANLRAMQLRQPEHPALQRYDEVAQIVTGRSTAAAAEGLAWVEALCAALAVPSLSSYGLAEGQFAEVVEKTSRASSTKANPLPLTEDELLSILRCAL